MCFDRFCLVLRHTTFPNFVPEYVWPGDPIERRGKRMMSGFGGIGTGRGMAKRVFPLQPDGSSLFFALIVRSAL